MKKYLCPICNKRACDSSKVLNLTMFSKSDAETADVVIKCKNCKSTLAVSILVPYYKYN